MPQDLRCGYISGSKERARKYPMMMMRLRSRERRGGRRRRRWKPGRRGLEDAHSGMEVEIRLGGDVSAGLSPE